MIWHGNSHGIDVRKHLVEVPIYGDVQPQIVPARNHAGQLGAIRCEMRGVFPGDFAPAYNANSDTHDGAFDFSFSRLRFRLFMWGRRKR